jgi:hypothetical protein
MPTSARADFDEMNCAPVVPAATTDPDDGPHQPFRNSTGHVYVLSLGRSSSTLLGTYTKQDITTSSGTTSRAIGTPSGWVSQNATPEEHVVYRSSNGHVHELWRNVGTGTWHHTDLTSAAGTTARAGGNVTGWGNTTRRVAYHGTDDHLHVLSWNSTTKKWRDTDVTKATHTKVTLYGDPFMRDCALVYRSSDDHVHLLNATAWPWKDTDVWAKAKAKVLALGKPTVYHSANGAPSPAALHILYRGLDHHVHELWGWDSGSWHTSDLSKIAHLSANVASDPVGWPLLFMDDNPGLTVTYLTSTGQQCTLDKQTGSDMYPATAWSGGCSTHNTPIRYFSPIVAADSHVITTWVTHTGIVYLQFEDKPTVDLFGFDMTSETGAPPASTGDGLYVTPPCSCYTP